MNIDFTEKVRIFHEGNGRHTAFNAELIPESAAYLVENFNYRLQRPCSEKHVAVLAEAMLHGEFRPFTSIDFAVLDSTPHLINGQHTLRAAALADKQIWLSLHLHRVETYDEIGALYSKYDVGRTRSIRDTMGEIGQELGLSGKERDSLAVAVNWINLDFKPYAGNDEPHRIYQAKNFELRKVLMREWAEEARIFFQLLSAAPTYNRANFHRGAVLGFALLTLRNCRKEAIDFWRESVMDDGLKIGDPRKALINWLRHNPVGKAPYAQHRAAIATWNAWMEGRKLSKVYPNTDAALRIAGTEIRLD